MAILGGSADYYLKKFIDDLKTYIPEIESFQMRWFDTVETLYKDGNYLLNNAELKDLDSLPAKLEELSAEGKSWINIYGEGKITGDIYLLSIGYNRESAGAHATSISATGPFLNLDGSPRMNARVKIID